MKTNELTKAALNYLVAKAQGATNFRYDTVATYWVTLDGKDRALSEGWAQSFCPSTNWAQGGPIIEREVIGTWSSEGGLTWHARGGLAFQDVFDGPTPLIAAMRCYVVSKLGDEVDVPKELL